MENPLTYMPEFHRYPFFSITIALFWLFAAFVVFISQRLVEQASIAVDPLERKTAFLRTALCIGCLVWALDAGGLIMYPAMIVREPRMAPIIMALTIMVTGSILSVPSLTKTRSRLVIACAAMVLALCMLAGHIMLISSFGTLTGAICWIAVCVSLLLAVSLAIALALRHRSERLRAFNGGFRPLSLTENLLAGATIVLMHISLASSTPLTPDSTANGHGEAVVSFVIFGALVASVQLYSMRVEVARQELMNRAHARLRALPDKPGFFESQQIALIAERLPALLAPENLHLHFQPIVPITGRVKKVRFEALLRMEDRQLGRINPEMFILACTRVNHQEAVDRMIIRKALDLSNEWSKIPYCAGISVNVSPETIKKASFFSWIHDELAHRGLPTNWLKLEMTEHSMVATDRSIVDTILRLQSIGVGVILDDFGTGFSSLGVITSLPIEGMKIDRSLTSNIEKCQSCQVLLKHLTALGKDLGLAITVEGAETAAQLKIIRKYHADAVQGYFFGKPMPPEMIQEWIENYTMSQIENHAIFPIATLPAGARVKS